MPETMDETPSSSSDAASVKVSFAFGEALVHQAEPYDPGDEAPAFNQWPCPGCGVRRPVDDTWRLLVSDAPHGDNERHVLVCALCASELRRAASPDTPLAG